jgi:hypothetical protein
MWIGGWIVFNVCINCSGYLMLLDVKGLGRKHSWCLSSCCPYSCPEDLKKTTKTFIGIAVFQQKFQLGISLLQVKTL